MSSGKWSGRGLSAGAWSGAAGTGENALGVSGTGVSLAATGPRPPQIQLASNAGYCYVDHSGTVTDAVYRTYYTTPDTAPTSIVHVARFRQGAAGTYAGSISLASTMALRIYKTGGQQVAAMAQTLAVSTRYRLEFKIHHDTTTPANGTMELKVFVGDSTTVFDTVTVTGQDFTVGHSRWIIGTDATTTAINATYHDDLAWASETQTYLGPWVDPNAAPTSTITSSSSTVSGGSTFTLTLGGTDSDGSVANMAVTQLSGPTATISGSGNTRTVVAPAGTNAAQPMVFQNLVTDNEGRQTPSTVTVTVSANASNNFPTATISGPASVNAGDTFTLALTSSDSDGTVASSVVDQTAGPTATITGSGNTRTVVAPATKMQVDQTMTFRHRATDNNGNVTPATTNVVIKKHAFWKMKNGVLTPRLHGSGTPPNPQTPITITPTVVAVGDGTVTVSWVVNPGTHTVDGVYAGTNTLNASGQTFESTLRTGLTGSQVFGNLVNNRVYTFRITAVEGGVRSTVATITATPVSTTSNGTADAVAIIGDSLTFRLNETTTDSRETYTRSQFIAAGWPNASIYWWGRGGKTMNTVDSGGKTALQNIADAKSQFPNKKILFIIGLGTNNGSLSNADFTAAVNTLLDAIGSTNLVAWTNLTYPAENNTTAVAKNPLIKSAVEARGGLYMDWNTAAHDLADQSIWLVNDSPHLTEAGNKARDAFIIDQVKTWLNGTTPPPPTGRDWWGGIGIYNGGPTTDADTLATFGKYPDISSSYVQPTFGGWNTTQVVNQMKRGTAPLVTWTTKYTTWITDFIGLNGTTAMTTAEAQADQYFALINAAISASGVSSKARMYVTTCHEHDVYSNTLREDVYYTGADGDPANYGKAMTKFITRARTKVTDTRVRWGMWFGGSRTAHINTVLTNLLVRPDFISQDPYVNNVPSAAQTAAGVPAQSALANFQEKTDLFRTTSGTYRANYVRLSALGGNTKMIPLAISEHGLSFGKTANGAHVIVHNDTQGASYYDGLAAAVKTLQLEFACHFNRNSGPNGEDKTDDGSHPLSVAAEGRALAASDASALI